MRVLLRAKVLSSSDDEDKKYVSIVVQGKKR